MIREADVAVVGAGSVGSMAAWQLSARGYRVIAMDRFSIPGPFSAYAGESRIFRKVYHEGGHYTPLLQRAQDLWRELEKASGLELLEVTGAVTILDEGNPYLTSLLEAGRSRRLVYEVLTSQEARARFPGHKINDTDTAVFDPEGGYVRSEKAVVAALRLAASSGSELAGNRKARVLERHGDRYVVHCDGESVVARKVIVASGTGAAPVCRALGARLAIRPQILTWFPLRTPGAYSRPGDPVFLRNSQDAQFYGFPSGDGWTVKVAASIYLDEVDSMERPLSWDPVHLDKVRSWAAEYLPEVVPDPVRTAICADGYTDDHTGLLGPVPGMPGVVAAVGFSGHGFKMASALGAVAADLAVEGETPTDVSFMRPDRFAGEDLQLDSLPLA
jgi:sarcosine oxidase